MSIPTLPATSDDLLLDALSAADLLKYSRTCKAAFSVVQEYKKRAFRVDRLLSRYFTPEEIIRFRELQYETGTLISGSTAVQFFDRDIYPESDLDLYAEHRFCRVMAEWLLEIGYKYTPLPESANVTSLEEAFNSNPPEREHVPHLIAEQVIAGQEYAKSPFVFNFEKKRPLRKIQLITSLTSPLQRILKFHSTCVMNIITHDKAYSFFPRATFEERRSLVCYLDGNEFRDRASKKYIDRGWTFVRMSDFLRPQKDQLRELFAFGPRYVGDRSCWTMPLSPALDLPRGHMESNSWRTFLSYYDNPSMSYTSIAAKNLKFSYVISIVEYGDIISTYLRDRVRVFERNGEDRQIMLDEEYLDVLRQYRRQEDEDLEVPESDSEPEDLLSDSDFAEGVYVV